MSADHRDLRKAVNEARSNDVAARRDESAHLYQQDRRLASRFWHAFEPQNEGIRAPSGQTARIDQRIRDWIAHAHGGWTPVAMDRSEKNSSFRGELIVPVASHALVPVVEPLSAPSGATWRRWTHACSARDRCRGLPPIPVRQVCPTRLSAP